MKCFFSVFLIAIEIKLYCTQVIDQSIDNYFAITGNFSLDDQYIALLSGESERIGNYFHFKSRSNSAAFFVNANKFYASSSQVRFVRTVYNVTNESSKFILLTPTNLSLSCVRRENYFRKFQVDCILYPDDPICNCLNQGNYIIQNSDSWVNCTNSTKLYCACIMDSLSSQLVPDGNVTFVSTNLTCSANVIEDINCISNCMEIPVDKTEIYQFYIDIKNLYGNMMLSKIDSCDIGTLSLHLMNLHLGSTSNFNVNNYMERLFDRPSSSQSYNYTPSFDFIPDDGWDYQTTIKTQYIEHDQNNIIFCNYRLNYTGHVRYVEINDQRGPSHGQSGFNGINGNTEIISDIYFQLRNGALNGISIYGYRINLTEITFTNCVNDLTNMAQVNPVFTHYYFNESLMPEVTPIYSTLKCQCPRNCLKCLDPDTCVKCNIPFVIYYGSCLASCPSSMPYPYMNICSKKLLSLNTFLKLPEFTENHINLTGYVDHSSYTEFVATFYATNQSILNSYNLVLIDEQIARGLSSSKSVYFQTITGYYSLNTSLEIIATSDKFGSDFSSFIIFPIQSDFYYTMAFYAYSSMPKDLNSTNMPQIASIFYGKEGKFYYLSRNLYYISEFHLNCIENCQIQITTDGICTVYMNDILLLFEINFSNRWTYLSTKILNGFNNFKIHIVGTFYFSLNIKGTYKMFIPYYPVSSSTINLVKDQPNACQINNCLSCYGSSCLTCNSGYFLSLDGHSCVADCSPNKFYRVERKCIEECGNSTITLNSTDCVPFCQEPGSYFVYNKGLTKCVDECQYCSDLYTCRSCLYESELNTDTFCFRKEGDFYSANPDFTINQSGSLIGDYTQNYMAVLTDDGIFSDNNFYFYHPQKISRILFATKIIPQNTSTGLINVPRINLSSDSNLTLHYLKLEQTNNSREFSIAAYEDISFMQWPIYKADLIVNPLNMELRYANPEYLPKLITSYTTIVLSKIYEITHNLDIYCSWEIEFSGNIRSMYLNGEKIFFYSQKSNTKVIKNTDYYLFRSTELKILTINTFMFDYNNIDIVDCKSLEGESLILTELGIKTYLYKSEDSSKNQFTVPKNIECSEGCAICTSPYYCIQCSDAFYLLYGTCQRQCDQSRPIYGLGGYCLNALQTQGFRSTSNFFKSNTFTYIWQLPIDFDAKFILYTFGGDGLETNFKLILPISKSYSLTESQSAIVSYKRDDIDLTTAQTILTTISTPSSTSDLRITTTLYTIKNNSLMLIYYNSSPSGAGQLNADNFEYVEESNKSFSFNPNSEYRMKFYIICTNCYLSIQLEGFIRIEKNDRTLLFEGYIHEYFGTVYLDYRFTSMSLLTLTISKASQFRYEITGSYYVMTFWELAAYDSAQLPGTLSSCKLANCENCYSATCYSCVRGSNYFLNTITKACAASCPINTFQLYGQSLCISTSCTAKNMTVLRNKCIFRCSEGYHWNYLTGCSSLCHIGCKGCGGPNFNDCLTCKWPLILDISSNQCTCPPGSVLNSTFGCSSISYINIFIPSEIQSCSINIFTATINTTEASFSNISYFWSLQNSTASLEYVLNLISYLSTQKSNFIYIPTGLLEVGREYNFSVSYINAVNQSVVNYAYTVTSLDSYPNVIIDGGLKQIFKPGLDNEINLLVSYSNCISVSTPLETKWEFLNGTFVNPDLYLKKNLPLYMQIPKCTLASQSKTLFLISVWMQPTPNFITEIFFEFSVAPESFTAKILNGNRYQPEGKNLTLLSDISYLSSCSPEPGNVTFTWSCSFNNSTVCADPLGLFLVPREEKNITVPYNYFKEGDRFSFSLNVSKNNVTVNDKTDIWIAPSTALMLSIVCSNCSVFSSGSQDYYFDVKLLGQGSVALLRFDWTFNIPFSYIQYGSLIKIPKIAFNIASNISFLLLEVSAQNATNQGYTFLSIPINQPPQGGILTVFPTYGISLSTYFLISTRGWVDSDLPIKNQFYYSNSPNENFNALLTDFQIAESTSTFLPGDNPTLTVYIILSVRDAYQSSNSAVQSVQVTSLSDSLSSTIQKTSELLETLSSSDPFLKAKTISLITAELNSWENKSTNTGSICPFCSGHGTCNDDSKCICINGWTYTDCSVSLQDFDDLIELKLKLLENLDESYSQFPTESVRTLVFNTLDLVSKNRDFNSNQTFLLISKVLEESLKILESNSTLTLAQANIVSNILSNMLSYSGYYDCNSSTNYSQNLANKTSQYLDSISKALLNDKIPNETASIINTESYSILAQKLSICELSSLNLNLGSDVPQSIIKYTGGASLNCSQILNLQFYAFDSNLMNCNASVQSKKNTITVKFTDPSGNDVKINASISIKFQLEDMKEFCLAPCEIIAIICDCNDISILDVKTQLTKLFFKSSIIKIIEFSALENFPFWEVAAFWGFFGFFTWLGSSFLVVKKFIPTFDVVINLKRDSKKTKLKIIFAAYLSIHPMLSVFCVYEYHELSKELRAFLYFIRNVLIMTFTAIFGSAGANDDIYQRLLNFNAYLFILPYFTIFPLENFIEWLLKKPSERTIREKGLSLNIVRRYQKKFKIGIIVVIIILIACFIINLTIAAASDENQRLEWTSDLIKSLLQDFFITPIIYLFGQFFAIKASQNKKLEKSMKIKRIIHFYISEPVFHLSQFHRGKRMIFPLTPKIAKIEFPSTETHQDLIRKESGLMTSGTPVNASLASYPKEKSPFSEIIKQESLRERPSSPRQNSANINTIVSTIEIVDLNEADNSGSKTVTREEEIQQPKLELPVLSRNSSFKSIRSIRSTLSRDGLGFDPMTPRNISKESQRENTFASSGLKDNSFESSKLENSFSSAISVSNDGSSNSIQTSKEKKTRSKKASNTLKLPPPKDLTFAKNAYKSNPVKSLAPKKLGEIQKPSSFRKINQKSEINHSSFENSIMSSIKASTQLKVSTDFKLENVSNELISSPQNGFSTIEKLDLKVMDHGYFDIEPLASSQLISPKHSFRPISAKLDDEEFLQSKNASEKGDESKIEEDYEIMLPGLIEESDLKSSNINNFRV